MAQSMNFERFFRLSGRLRYRVDEGADTGAVGV
jgi:hypothetical protein